MDNIWILAQAEANKGDFDVSTTRTTGEEEATTLVADSNMPQTQTQKPGLGYLQYAMLGLMLVVFYFLIFRGPQKQKQKRKQLVQSLKKNDRVQTIGGIIGTIVDIKDDEITLKVDESNNTKIKFVSSAVGKNMSNNE